MYRRMIVCVVAFCALFAQAANAKPAERPRGIRIQVASGASLSFITGWTVCADAAARNPYRFAGLPKIPCPPSSDGAIRMHFDGSGRPVDLYIVQTDDPAVTETMLKDATLELITAMSAELCAQARAQAGYDVGACRWTLGSLAGHTVFTWNGTFVAERDPLKMKYESHAISVADSGGYMTLLAFTPVMVRAKTDLLIRQLEDSLVIDAATADAPPPLEPVKLSPVPGMSLTIPKGWIACDDANNALLGYASDPLDEKPQVCGKASPDLTMRLRVYNPRPLRTTVVSVFFDTGIRFTADKMQDFSDHLTPEVKAKFCADVTKPMLQDNVTVESCDFTMSSVAGHMAIATEVVGTPPNNAIGRFRLRMFDIANDNGYLQVQINTPVAIESTTKPDIDAIVASLAIDGADAEAADGQRQQPPRSAPPPPKPATSPGTAISWHYPLGGD